MSETVIARETRVQGQVTGSASGRIRVDGRVVGGILTDGAAEVGETGEVAGDIRAEEVVIAGTVYGNVIAGRRLHLRPTARVFGDFIRTRELKVDQGALFQGKCEIENEARPAEAELRAAAEPRVGREPGAAPELAAVSQPSAKPEPASAPEPRIPSPPAAVQGAGPKAGAEPAPSDGSPEAQGARLFPLLPRTRERPPEG